MKNKNKKIIISILVIVILAIIYALADRYLIEHVEKEVDTSANTNNNVSSDGTTNSSETSSNTTSSDLYTSTDMSYTSSTKTISIKKVTTGSGNDTVTYYVADVVLKNATDLVSAFAKNKFGTNITEYTSTIASNNNAIFAINGDYYGFRDDGVIIRNGVIYRNVPTRTGLAIYKDGTMKIYDENSISAEQLVKDGVWNTYSFGPALLENSQILSGITDMEVDANIGNHSMQGSQPRTGIGIIDQNHFVFVVVDGRSQGYSKGVTMDEFAKIFKELGCSTAYNMDGGGSSVMYFMGKLINNPLGKNLERGTSDILYIK